MYKLSGASLQFIVHSKNVTDFDTAMNGSHYIYSKN